MSIDQTIAAYEARVAAVPEVARRFAEETWGKTWAHAEMGSLLDFAALSALSAQSTGSAGVAAEPVAWVYEQQHPDDAWTLEASRQKPGLRKWFRKIEPVFKHPPVAAEPVAGIRRDALAPFADAWRSCQDLGEQGAGYVQDSQDAWVSGNRNGGAHPLFKFGDLRRAAEALTAAPTPPAGGGETEAGDLVSLSAGATDDEKTSNLSGAVWSLLRVWDGCDELPEKLELALSNFEDAWSLFSEAPAAPAAPRKGPSEEEIARLIADAAGYIYDPKQSEFGQAGDPEPEDWLAAARAVLALLTPADRGETQAVGDGWRLVPVKPTYSMVTVGIEARWRSATRSADCIREIWAAMLAGSPSPDQNRGEPDQGGAIMEAGR